MKWPKTKEEKKSLIITLIINAILFILFFFVGLTYLDPKPEEGIAIQFGFNADAGGPSRVENIQNQQQRITTPPITSQTEIEEIKSPTQDIDDAPAVSQNRKEKKTPQPQNPTRKETPQPTEQNQQQIDQRLQNIINNPNRGTTGQSGSGSQAGAQGSPISTSESGNTAGSGTGGGSSGTGYFLGGRTAQVKPKPDYNCPETGRIVVRIKVDQNGNVIEATPGVSFQSYSTNVFSECLNRNAREAAMRTKWSSDPDAPDEQVGFIIYEFRKN